MIFKRHSVMRRLLVLIAILVALLSVMAAPSAHAQGPWTGAMGIQETNAQIMARQAQLGPLQAAGKPVAKFEPEDESPLEPNPNAPNVAQIPAQPPDVPQRPQLPQTLGLTFTGATFNGEPGLHFVPPDTMGAAGPTQYLIVENGVITSFTKATGFADGILNASTNTFFASVLGGGNSSDPQARYDRLSQRWFVTMIDTTTPNRVMLAVSGGSTIGIVSTWTFFQFRQDLVTPTGNGGCLFDYPTTGIDVNALYIGGTEFCPGETAATVFVVKKASILGAGPIVVAVFRNVGTPGTSTIHTPRGVDSWDPVRPFGYFIGQDYSFNGTLHLLRIANTDFSSPPTFTDLTITVPNYFAPLPVDFQGNNHPGGGFNGFLDASDNRMMPSVIRNGNLWTSHGTKVNSSGVGSGTGDRDATQWFEFGNIDAVPTTIQMGTIFDPAAVNPVSYTYGTLMVSGQGHVVAGMTAVNPSTFPDAADSGRLATDPLGSMAAVTRYTASSAAYTSFDNGTSRPRRWGDYTDVSLDPCDDMTLWNVQEYVDATASWGVKVAQMKAPPPASMPAGAFTPGSVATGQPSVNVAVVGTSVAGSGFYDTPAMTEPCRTRLTASITNSVIVNSVTYTDLTHITLNISTVGATTGTATVTVTNPDGQTSTGNLIITGIATPTPTASITPSRTNTPSATPSNTATATATSSNTPTGTLSATATNTATATPSSTATRTFTPTNTATATASATPSNTATVAPTSTNTPTPTSTPSGPVCTGPMGGANPGALPNDTIGLYDPPDSFFYLRNSNSAGAQDFLFQFGPAPSSLKPISGDWINQGKTTVGLFDPGTSTFYLKLHNTSGVADYAYQFTPVVTGRIPLSGDWIGTGVKSGGEYDSTIGTFYLRNSNSPGGADTTFVYGPGGTDLYPLAGDWFGLGHDTVGLYSLSNACFYLKHDNAAGTSVLDYQFQYGPGHGLGIPVVGHWVGGTQTSIGVYVPADAFWYLKNTNAAGNADTQFQYGPGPNSGWLPVIGHWGAPGTIGITPSTDVPTRINGSLGFVSNREGKWGIYKLNGDDTHTQRLTAIGDNPVESRPAWSADGKQVAFVSAQSGNPEIYTMNADGSNIKRLTYTKALNYQPTWSADGKQIAFVSNRDNTINIYVMNSDGSNVQQITHGMGIASEEPAWSPDGKLIAYATGTGTLNIAVMNDSGSKSQRLTTNGRDPVWSPDGTQIAFASTRDGGAQIYVMNADGSNVRRLTNSSAQDEMPTWSPDGTQIAFASTRDGRSQIYVINANGSNDAQRLSNSLGQDKLPVWLPR